MMSSLPSVEVIAPQTVDPPQAAVNIFIYDKFMLKTARFVRRRHTLDTRVCRAKKPMKSI
jgi:hypothetical protein